jgi:hypothetical protein
MPFSGGAPNCPRTPTQYLASGAIDIVLTRWATEWTLEGFWTVYPLQFRFFTATFAATLCASGAGDNSWTADNRDYNDGAYDNRLPGSSGGWGGSVTVELP